MTEKELIKLELDKYISLYYENVTAHNAKQVVDGFNRQWSNVIGYMIDETPEHHSKYGLALVIFSVAIFESSSTTEQTIKHLADLIEEYDKKESVKYKFGIKQSLFFNLGSCWHKLGTLYDGMAIDAFKRYIYYLIVQSSNTSYRPTAYAFKKCTTFLYQSLINDQLNISSPVTFNDPFDCPIRELLNNDDDVSYLIRQAYRDCLKIACFISNDKLPYLNESNEVIREKKHDNDVYEYLNELMWAHYADSHRGICVKYKFPGILSILGSAKSNKVAYFKDVKYSDNDLSKYSSKDSITLEDAFFLKGEQWEYENELRYLYFDLEGDGEYGTVNAPNCIEAIYFGMRCPESDRRTIYNIMKDKKLITYDLNGVIKEEKPVQFYQMKVDKSHFGQIKVVDYQY